MPAVAVVPYCGAPAHPDNLWLRWNLDPVLIAVLLLILGLYLGGLRRRPADGTRLVQWRASAFVGGWAVV
jgi:hypothetical protein